MSNPIVLFINCTHRSSPEISDIEVLWQCAATLYQQQGALIQSFRTIDLWQSPNTVKTEAADFNRASLFSSGTSVVDSLQQADILIVGMSLLSDSRSSECQRFIEQLNKLNAAIADVATSQPILYNKILGVVAVGNSGGKIAIAKLCYDLNQLGGIIPPYNTLAWFKPAGTAANFIEAKGQNSPIVNTSARLLVENSLALAKSLRQIPLSINIKTAAQSVRKIANANQVEKGTFILPKPISTPEHPIPHGIDYRQTTKRIWTMMRSGIQRGFTFQIISLKDRTFRAEREDKGFIYKIYPGHFSFRRQYADYDAEQLKSRKLSLLEQQGLSVPVSYGTFKTTAELPTNLPFSLVAKPDSGSLSQNVFPNLQTPQQLRQAASIIEASGDIIKLESYISGRDYRVLIINHQYAGCVERRPANITGDGQQTIRELFDRRNAEPERGDRYEEHTTLHKLVFDDTSRELLRLADYTLETVLPKDKIFYLQRKITASTGSDYIDCTDRLHSSIISDCVAFSHQFSTLTLGFDIITPDITRPLAEVGGAFNEYNFLPYVDLHENCNVGQKRPVCKLVWDYIEKNSQRLVTDKFEPF